MIRRVGDPPIRGQTYTLRPGAYALLPQRNGLLLTAQVTPQLDVQLPGGGIDPGESPVQALYREVLEEIGWRIARPRRLGAYRRFVFMPEYDLWAEKLCHVYLAHPIYQITEPKEPDHITMHLNATQAIACLSSDGDRMFAQEYFA